MNLPTLQQTPMEPPLPDTAAPVPASAPNTTLSSDAALTAGTPAAPEQSASSISSQVWKIAWPSVITFSLMTTNSILDRAFVGQLGTDSLAAVGVGGQVAFLFVSLSMAVSVGTTALVARFTGAKEPEQVSRATGQSLSLSLLLSLLFIGGGFLALEPLLASMNLDTASLMQCRAFLHVLLLAGTVPMFLANVLGSAFRGIGDTRSPLKVMICANLVHILGDWTLMLGHWGAPKLGVVGGSIAMSLSNLMALLVYLALMRRAEQWEALTFRNLRLTMEWTRRILKIGAPAAVTALLRTTSLMGFTGILSRTVEHTAGIASLPIGMTAESIAFMPGFGFSVAASALVGQSLGAKEPRRAERFAWMATWQAVATMTLMGVVFYVFADWFAGLFTQDAQVHALAVSYLRIMAFSEPLLAFGMVLTGALQGAGDTISPTVITVASQWLLRVPLAAYMALTLHMNTHGAWIAMSLSTAVGGLLTVALFRWGRWKKIKV